MSAAQRQKGFTLVEIMIVVAIIALLAAISIPNLLRTRMNSNEGAMKKGLRTFSQANESYRAAQTIPAYASAITDLTGSSPAYLDSTWDTNPKHGYNLTYSGGGAASTTYSAFADAQSNQASTDYCVDQTGIIFSGGSGTATGCTGGTALTQ